MITGEGMKELAKEFFGRWETRKLNGTCSDILTHIEVCI